MTLGERSVALGDPEVERRARFLTTQRGFYRLRDMSHDHDGSPEEDEDDEPEDVQETLKESCQQTTECMKAREPLDACTDRVNSKKATDETCFEELLDFVHCVDACVAKTLFTKLK